MYRYWYQHFPTDAWYQWLWSCQYWVSQKCYEDGRTQPCWNTIVKENRQQCLASDIKVVQISDINVLSRQSEEMSRTTNLLQQLRHKYSSEGDWHFFTRLLGICDKIMTGKPFRVIAMHSGPSSKLYNIRVDEVHPASCKVWQRQLYMVLYNYYNYLFWYFLHCSCSVSYRKWGLVTLIGKPAN